MLLAVETSGHEGSLALLRDQQIVAACELQTAGRRHAQTLVSEADALLKSVNASAHDVSAVAVSIGPGSFTGLRVGLVFAKTLAWLQKIPLIAVDTHLIIARQCSDMSVRVITDAQRNEVFVSTFRRAAEGSSCQETDPIHILRMVDLPNDVPLSGPAVSKLTQVVSDRSFPMASGSMRPTATMTAMVGHELLLKNLTADPESLEPVYVRASYAEEKRALSSATSSPSGDAPASDT